MAAVPEMPASLAALQPPRAAPEPVTDAEALGRRLEEIEAAAAAPVDALEPALRAILEAAGASAGALCLYDQRRELLRLAAEVGLSDEGCHRLRTVRRGDATSWDMPLHGLINRRAYLIEKASQNRYVPPLVDDVARVRTVVCLPLIAGTTPVGSIVLVTLAPRMLTERDIRGLEQALRALAKLIEALRRREAAVAAATKTAAPAPAAGVDDRHTVPPHRRAPEGPSPDAEHVRSLTAALEAAQRDQARLAAALQEAEAERARLAEQVRGEAPTVDHVEIDRLRARLAEAEAGAAHEQRAREELEAALQRGVTAGQHDLQGALEAARRAESARVSLAAENAGLAAEVEQLRAGMPADEAHAAERRETNRLRARLAEAEAGAAHEQRAREQLEVALQRTTTESQRALREALEAARTANAARAVLEAEKSRLEAEVERQRAGMSGDGADRVEVDRLRARLAESEAGAAHEHRAREELEATVQRGASASHLELRRALEAARRADAARVVLTAQNERLTTELAQLASGAPRDEARLTELMAEVDRLRARLAEAEAGAAHEHRAREELEASLQRSTSEGRRELRNDLEAAWRAEAARAALAAENVRLAAELKRLELDGARSEPSASGDEARDTAADAERDALRGALEEARAREHELALKCDQLSELTAELERDRDRLAADAGGAVQARGHLEEALARGLDEARAHEQVFAARLEARERELEALQAEHAATGASLTNATSESDRLREAIAGLEGERDRLAADIEGASAARARLEEALATSLEEARAREQDVTTRLEARERELEALRADRVAATAQLEVATTDGDRLREAVALLEAERDRLAADLDGAGVARKHLEESLDRTVEEAHAREEEITARLAAQERTAESLRTEYAAQATAEAARVEALQAEQDRLREAAATLDTERGRLAADLEGAAAARSRLEETLARAAEEARAHEQELRAQLEARERDMDALRADRATEAASTVTQLETLGAECARLREALHALEASGDAPAADSGEPLGAEPPAEDDAAPAPAEEERPAATPSGGGPIVVLDTDQAWARAAAAGRQVVVLEPKRNLAAQLSQLNPARIVVNLASPGALDALLSLRAGKFVGGFWGCLADPATNRALLLRMVEPAARPLEPDAIVASLGRFTKRGARVVTVGDDVEALVSLRQALAREGLSVSMAWNGRQADELFPVVRPTLVILDLELPGHEGPGIVTRLAAGRSVPDLVLIPGATDPAGDFATALANSPRDSRTLSLGRVLAQVLRGAE